MRGIIISEQKLLERALNGELKGNLKKEKPMKVLHVLTKYYFNKGLEEKEIKNKIILFLEENYECYKPTKWDNVVLRIIKKYKDVAKKRMLDIYNITEVEITNNEWNKIIGLDDKILERVAFIMLVYQKITEKISPKSNAWINQSIDAIFKEAAVYKRGMDQRKVLYELYKLEYIEQPKACDKTSFKINFVDRNSDIKFKINSFENVISYYYEYRNNEKYKKCEVCDIRFRIEKTKGRKKYCSLCAKKVKKKQDKIRKIKSL